MVGSAWWDSRQNLVGFAYFAFTMWWFISPEQLTPHNLQRIPSAGAWTNVRPLSGVVMCLGAAWELVMVGPPTPWKTHWTGLGNSKAFGLESKDSSGDPSSLGWTPDTNGCEEIGARSSLLLLVRGSSNCDWQGPGSSLNDDYNFKSAIMTKLVAGLTGKIHPFK